MSPLYIPTVGFLMLISLALTSAHPLQSTVLTKEDLDVLKVSVATLKKNALTSVYTFIIIISIYAEVQQDTTNYFSINKITV